jgi:hypothetical protein
MVKQLVIRALATIEHNRVVFRILNKDTAHISMFGGFHRSSS